MAVSDQEMLDAINDGLLALVKRGVQTYRIGTALYTYQDLDKLHQLKSKYETRVARATKGDFGVATFASPT